MYEFFVNVSALFYTNLQSMTHFPVVDLNNEHRPDRKSAIGAVKKTYKMALSATRSSSVVDHAVAKRTTVWLSP